MSLGKLLGHSSLDKQAAFQDADNLWVEIWDVFNSHFRPFSDDGTMLPPNSVKRPLKITCHLDAKKDSFLNKKGSCIKKDSFQGPGAISKLLKKLRLPFSPITQLRFMGHVGNLGQTSYRQPWTDPGGAPAASKFVTSLFPGNSWTDPAEDM